MNPTISADAQKKTEQLGVPELLQLAAVQCGGSMEAQFTGLAITLVVSRIVDLEPEDRQLLLDCFVDISECHDQEDVQDCMQTVIEILSPNNGRIQTTPLEEVEDTAPDKLDSWLVYISNRIKTEREEKGMTQQQLAAATGIQQSHISRLENAQHSPSGLTLEKIAKALDLDPTAFSM